MDNSKKIEVNMITMLILIIFSLYKNRLNERKPDNKSDNWLEEKWSNVKLGNN